MKKFFKLTYLVLASLFLVLISCKQSDDSKKGVDTILKGKVTILVDETLKPIIDDQIAVFESKYEAKINLDARSEKELIKAFLNDSAGVAVLSRTLNQDEIKYFERKRITPKTTKIGIDAIAFIRNNTSNDTLIALEDVLSFMQGKKQTNIKGLVFDNPNSSTVRYMNDLAGLDEMPTKDVFSFKTNEDVIKYVSENEGMVGVVGVNWLSQPSTALKGDMKNINVLNVKSLNNIGYFAPSQNNIAEGTYPLARDLYIINCQGYSGLGMGFASFVAGDIGQRIILKSGLLPFRMPGRNIIIKTKSNTDEKKMIMNVNMNKLKKVKMNKFKILGVAFLSSVTFSHAQDIDQAKKEMDAEKYQNAKITLKSIIKADPDEGLAYFLLGNVYLTQRVVDSAKISYQNGLRAKDEEHFNYIGLGQMDLNDGNVAAAKIKFDLAIEEMGRRDFEEFVYVAKAYMNAYKPDYKAAISTLKRVDEKYSQEPLVLIAFGDAYYGDKNQNDAYSAYRNAFRIDNTLIRAKMQLGVLLKGAKAYTEAVNAFNDVIATNPNYGPLYRELAETYYYWAVNVPSRNDQYMKQALSYYEKYMVLTDYSLASRMRHADFLIVAHDYKALEIEADKMKEIDNVNPRILRYLGYSAYFNDNVDVAIKALEDFTANASNNVMSLDYLYLGFANIKKATMGADLTVAEPVLFNKGIALVKKAYALENSVANDLSEAGKDLYEKKMYKEAAAIFEIATSYKESKNYLLDNFYLGNSLYFDNTKTGAVKDSIALNKADVAFGNVIEASPATQDVYVYRARTNSLLGNDELMIKYYQQYIDIVTKKGPEELAIATVTAKLVEAYNTMAAGYANTDKVKAIEFFNKTLAIDPENGYAKQSVNTLK